MSRLAQSVQTAINELRRTRASRRRTVVADIPDMNTDAPDEAIDIPNIDEAQPTTSASTDTPVSETPSPTPQGEKRVATKTKRTAASKKRKPTGAKAATTARAARVNGVNASGKLTGVELSGANKDRVRLKFENGHITLRPSGGRGESAALVVAAITALVRA